MSVANNGKRIGNAVEEFVRALPERTFFHTAEISVPGSPRTVQRALRRLVEDETVMRCMRGIYYRPAICSPSWGPPFAAPPDISEILTFLGSLTGEIFGIHGAVARNGTGLSLDVPMVNIFHTTGRSRVLSVFGRRDVRLVHIDPRFMRLSEHPVHPVLMALIWTGNTKWRRELVDMEMMEYFHRKLTREHFAFLNSRRDAMPAWLSKKFDTYLRTPLYALNEGPHRPPASSRFKRSDDEPNYL